MTATETTCWVVADGGDEDQIGKAIERWHVEHDIACPADEQFVEAVWLMPEGSTFAGDPYRDAVTLLRVVMPCGNVYVIEVEHEGDCDGGDWSPVTYFNVLRAEVLR